MIRLLILIMLGAIALGVSYFFFKSVPMGRKMLVVGGGLFAALAAAALQMNNPLYIPVLVIVGVALLLSLIYMKVVEKNQNEKMKQSSERKSRMAVESSLKKSKDSDLAKAFTIESIEMDEGERKFG
ncbi:hypothetical protein [Planomicrobium sp. MB-3u-38]|uniref:hypothetical protein n=1 Tax=Planomicrobium sp. MB-3u-38 TaxID=2058318 RepID=UPI000C7B9843|nr:hypothetical protein [Planomicrobium sp. MB-3u-38]PKH08470.1 hypothetical protein CXF70_18050 [Planomicrobium sp. MB-3u-38]